MRATGHIGDESAGRFVTAWAEMGSATSRNPPGRRHNVRLAAPGRSLIVAGGLSETAARRMAAALTELLEAAISELLDEPDRPAGTDPAACASCAAPVVWSGQGRRPLYCSPACRQAAYRHRRGR